MNQPSPEKAPERKITHGKTVKLSIEKDDDGGYREQVVEIRSKGEAKPMGLFSRRRVQLMSGALLGTSVKDINDDDKYEKSKHQPRVQYTLRARRKLVPTSEFTRVMMNCGCCTDRNLNLEPDTADNFLCICCNPTKLLSNYLFWTFSTSFSMLLIASLFFFMLLILIFSGLIMVVGTLNPQCFGGGYGSGFVAFNDAFTLSWATFSTVGYGNIYPNIGSAVVEGNPELVHECGWFSFLCSIEAFIGVLYAGFCGAILFGKVLRIQSTARVKFSDPIVINYGSGVENDDTLDSPDSIPCPVMEFRLVNSMNEKNGGEIMDATLNCVAMLNAPAISGARAQSHTSKHFDNMMKKIRKSRVSKNYNGSVPRVSKDYSGSALGHGTSVLTKSINDDVKVTSFDIPSSVDNMEHTNHEDKRIFEKLSIESPEHPFFRRVWTARHVLDQSSPILAPDVRKRIKLNNGSWPPELNNHESVRNSIMFKQIAVSFAGVSNVSASNVYAYKVYNFIDVNVGYKFASVLYKDENELIHVDGKLINDVLEQNGGGGEPLIE